jgi:hypothetical protein
MKKKLLLLLLMCILSLKAEGKYYIDLTSSHININENVLIGDFNNTISTNINAVSVAFGYSFMENSNNKQLRVKSIDLYMRVVSSKLISLNIDLNHPLDVEDCLDTQINSSNSPISSFFAQLLFCTIFNNPMVGFEYQYSGFNKKIKAIFNEKQEHFFMIKFGANFTKYVKLTLSYPLFLISEANKDINYEKSFSYMNINLGLVYRF